MNDRRYHKPLTHKAPRNTTRHNATQHDNTAQPNRHTLSGKALPEAKKLKDCIKKRIDCSDMTRKRLIVFFCAVTDETKLFSCSAASRPSSSQAANQDASRLTLDFPCGFVSLSSTTQRDQFPFSGGDTQLDSTVLNHTAQYSNNTSSIINNTQKILHSTQLFPTIPCNTILNLTQLYSTVQS